MGPGIAATGSILPGPSIAGGPGELGIENHTGTNEPGVILRRKKPASWRDYLVEGDPVTNPFDVEMLWP